MALLHAQVFEPIAVDDGSSTPPGVMDLDEVEHGRDLTKDILLTRGPCPGFNLPQKALGFFLEIVLRQQRVRFYLTL